MTYESILDFWKKENIKNANELASVLNSYSVNFAYNSGKIENDEITYHDTREVFDKNGVISYTGSTKTLFEIQRLPMKECYWHLMISKSLIKNF